MLSDMEVLIMILIYQIKIEDRNILDKLCTVCLGNKLTKVVRWNKSMTAISNKLEEIHANFWEPYNPLLESKSIYATIIIFEHMQKTWTLYLESKYDFVDTFQTWLPQFEAKSNFLVIK